MRMTSPSARPHRCPAGRRPPCAQGAARPHEAGRAAGPPTAPAAAREPRRLPPLLRRAWYGLNQAFRHRALANGITPDQYTVLRILSESPGRRLTQSELAETMSSDPNTIASLLRRMERQELLERRPHPKDGRAHCLVLRPKGRRTFRQAREGALALQQQVLGALPETDRDKFLAQLEAVSTACWKAAHPDDD